MHGNRTLGAAVVFSGALLTWMTIAASGVAADQLGDPLIGYLAVHTAGCLAVAAAVLISGSLLFVLGRPKKAAAARLDRNQAARPMGRMQTRIR